MRKLTKTYTFIIPCACSILLNACTEITEYEDTVMQQTASPQTAMLVEHKIQIDDSIRKLMNAPCGEHNLDVDLVFDETYDIETQEYLLEYNEKGFMLNGKTMNESAQKSFVNHRLQERSLVADASIARKQKIMDSLNKRGIIQKTDEKDFVEGNEPLHAIIDACKIKSVLDTDYLLGIEKHVYPDNQNIESALFATYVMQSFALPNNKKGDGVGIYMSESKCPYQGYTYDYTRLTSGSDDAHSTLVASILRKTSPASHIFCRHNNKLPYSSDIGYNIYVKPIFIASLSFGSNKSSVYDGTDKSADDLIYNYYITIVAAAGNKDNKNPSGYVTSPAKGINVISVGSYNDHGYHPNYHSQYFTLSDFSPIIPPHTGNTKPELVAPGLGYTHTYNNITLTGLWGTSFAAPVVSGMIANYLSSLSPSLNYALMTPNLMKAAVLLGATDPIVGNANHYGQGGADYEKMYNIRSFHEYSGVYASFDTAKAGDPIPNNDALDFYTQTIPASSTNGRIAISWITRGSYTYAHRNDSYPIGQSYSVKVRDPNGNQVGYNLSWYNNYVVVNFSRTTTGAYHVEIRRIANRDTNAKFQLAYALYY